MKKKEVQGRAAGERKVTINPPVEKLTPAAMAARS
jgi:hypothetical protein